MEKQPAQKDKPMVKKLPPSRAEALESGLQPDEQQEQSDHYERTYRDGSLQNECWHVD